MEMTEQQLQGVLDKLTALHGTLTEFGKRLDTNDNALVKVNGQITEFDGAFKGVKEAVDNLKAMQKKRATTIMPGLEDEVEKNGGINPVEALFNPNSRDASLAREYTNKRLAIRAQDGQQRDATAGDDGKGAVFIPTIALPGYIDKIRERSLFWRTTAGPKPTIWSGLQGFPVEIPNILEDVTVESTTETSAPTASDIATGMIKLEPRVLRSLTKFSRRLRRLGPTAEQAIRLSMEKQMGLKLDKMVLRGSGTDKESLGVVNTPGILSIAIGANGGNFTMLYARAMKHKLRQNSQGQLPSAAFVGHPDAFYTVATERIAQYSGQTDGMYVMPAMSEEQVRSYIGPYFDTTMIPVNLAKGSSSDLTEVNYANWEDMWIGFWEDFTFRVTDQAGTSWENSQVWIMAELEYDTQVVQPLSFVLCNDAKSVTL
jgi:HK97 family phage major capsid protein